ncbi:MAG: DUF4212 domain-containing protein [Beijerinckiaceae bacterium]
MPDDNQAARQRHWSKTFNLTMVVLAIWVVFAFILPWFAKDLNAFKFMGFPLGYYMCVQGSLIAFLALIWIQNWVQDGIDDEYDPETSKQK